MGGKVFMVSSTSGANYQELVRQYLSDFDGELRFFTTIQAAITASVADRGDVIFVAPGYAETVTSAGGITASVDGTTILGLGVGADRPTITLATNNTATILVSGDSVTIKNWLVIGNKNGITNPINVTGANPTLDIEYRDTSASVEAVTAIQMTSVVHGSVKLKYQGFIAGSSCVNAIEMNGCDDMRVDVDFYGKASTGVVEFAGAASKNVIVNGDFYVSGTTNLSKNVVDTIGGSTWSVDGFDGAAGGAFSGGSGNAVAIGDLSVIAADVALIKAYTSGTDSAANVLGADDADNGFASTNVVANADGSVLERLETIQQAVGGVDGASNVLGVNDADNGFDSSAVTSNRDGSLLERTETILVALLDNDVLNVIGADNNNNNGATTNVTANADGTIVERLEYVQTDMLALPRCVEKSDGAVLTGNDALFVISGGPIKILSLVGIVKTVIGGAANGDVQLVTTSPAGTVNLNAAPVAIDSDAAGTSYTMRDTTGVFTPTTAGFVLFANSFATNETEYLAPAGQIEFRSSAAQTGVIAWYLRYIPLSPLSRVTAAA
jgi:hypothetical protein